MFYLFALVAFIFGSHWQATHLAFLFYVGYPAAIIFPALLHVPVQLGHLWSLNAEEQFYMIWPLLMAKVKRPLILCGAAIAIGIVLRFVLLLNGIERSWIYFFLPCRMDGLAVGATIALLWRTAQKERLRRWAPLTLAASFVGLCFLYRYALLSWFNTALALCLGSLVVISLTYPKVFSLSVLRMFGRYSYGMYLFHIPLMPVFERLKPALSFGYVPFCLLANLAIAAASFHFFEAPILSLKSRFSYAPHSSVITSASPIPADDCYFPRPRWMFR